MSGRGSGMGSKKSFRGWGRGVVRYVARDADGSVFVYDSKPKKVSAIGAWACPGGRAMRLRPYCGGDLFPAVRWSDDEATVIVTMVPPPSERKGGYGHE